MSAITKTTAAATRMTEEAKQSTSFEQEYNLKYLGKIGNVFHTKDIEAAIEKGRKYNPGNIISFSSKSKSIDLACGSYLYMQMQRIRTLSIWYCDNSMGG